MDFLGGNFIKLLFVLSIIGVTGYAYFNGTLEVGHAVIAAIIVLVMLK